MKIFFTAFLIFITLFGSFAAQAQSDYNFFLKERKTVDDVYNTDELTRDRGKHWSLIYHVNHKLDQLTDVSAYEINYGRRLKDYWWEFMILKASPTFSAIAEPTSALTANAGFADDLDDTTEDLFTFGTGLRYKSNLTQLLVKSDSMYETTTAYITYSQLKEKFSSQTYSGPGLKTDLGIHRIMTPAFHLALKLSYNLGLLKHEKDFSDQKSRDRSLNVSWMSLGFEAAYNY